MNKYLMSISIACILFACNSPQDKNLDEFKWFIGKWEGNREEIILEEIWKEQSPSSFSGDGLVFIGNDTLFHEKLTLRSEGADIVYTVTMPNSKDPVPFKLISSEKNKWSFENKEHDFPQLVVYELINPDSLVATIEGIDKGKPSKEVFYFKKAN